MRRGELGIVLLLLAVGAAGVYFGYFHASTICDSTSGVCHTHAAGTVELLPTFVGAFFLVLGLGLFWRAFRPRS